MDDRVAQFLVSVGKLCADAHLGGLTVRLVLDNGEQVVGVAAAPPESQGPDELDSTGYVDRVWIGGVTVPLSEVLEATIHRPPSPDPRTTADTTAALHDGGSDTPASLGGPGETNSRLARDPD